MQEINPEFYVSLEILSQALALRKKLISFGSTSQLALQYRKDATSMTQKVNEACGSLSPAGPREHEFTEWLPGTECLQPLVANMEHTLERKVVRTRFMSLAPGQCFPTTQT